MKLKEFLKQFKDFDPELEVYRPDYDSDSEDKNGCWNNDVFENQVEIVFVSDKNHDFKTFTKNETISNNKKAILIY